MSTLKRKSLSLIDSNFAVNVAAIRRAYGLQIVRSVMIYERYHHVVSRLQWKFSQNWPDGNYYLPCQDLTKAALIRTVLIFFSFLIFNSRSTDLGK